MSRLIDYIFRKRKESIQKRVDVALFMTKKEEIHSRYYQMLE